MLKRLAFSHEVQLVALQKTLQWFSKPEEGQNSLLLQSL